jgi:hypothetical protein
MGKECVPCMMEIEYIISINCGLPDVHNSALREILKCVLAS